MLRDAIGQGMTRKVLIARVANTTPLELVLGAGLEPASLSAYAPQTYVSAIPPPERGRGSKLSAERTDWQVSSVGLQFVLACLPVAFAKAGNRNRNRDGGG